MLRARALVGLMLATVALACSSEGSDADRATTATDLDVYRTLIDSLFIPEPNADGEQRIVIRDSTDIHRVLDMTSDVIEQFRALPEMDEAMVQSFASRNNLSRSLAELKGVSFGAPMELVGARTLDSLQKAAAGPDEYWVAVADRYPGSNGMLSLSSVGYNEAGDRALVAVKYGCGAMCGGSTNYLLELIDGAWQVIAIQETSIA